MIQNSFLAIIEQSIRNHWDLPVMTDYEGETLYYKDLALEINKLHDIFKAAGVQRGDKISICGKNCSNWAIVFFATLSYGAVSVSILHEFDKGSVQFIVDHSDSKLLFIDENIWDGINEDSIQKNETVFTLDKLSLIKTTSDELKQFMSDASAHFENKYKNGFFINDVDFRTDKPEELAVINYTSGTTSSPKGVMIPYRSLWSNTKFANENVNFVHAGDNIVCMLPMAHTYGLAFEILNSIALGCHIHFLGKTPSPKILKDIFSKTKPKLVLAVPLIIEKIVTKVVLPKLKVGYAATLKKIPLLNYLVYNKVCKSMIEFFGGDLVEVVVGGAALNIDVENFLKKIKFPFTVGYGMTECGPLISYSFWKDYKKRSAGKVVDRMKVKIDSRDPENIVGEILAKGSNLMLGYYKNEEATSATFTPDGWLKTGDLGTIDKDDFIFIKGRNKNLLLGPSGQNIYPEEIEEKLNSSDYIAEVLIIGEDHRIIALIVPDFDYLKSMDIKEEKWNALFTDVINEVNSTLHGYSKIASFRIQETEFDKTPKRSIKRFKYQK